MIRRLSAGAAFLFMAASIIAVSPPVPPEIRLLQAAQKHARLHGAKFAPILSPADELLQGAPPRIDMKAVQNAGFPVVPWTVDKAGRIQELIELGANGIISDRPDLLRAAVIAHDRAHPSEAFQDADGTVNATRFDPEGHRGGRDLRPENTLPAFEVGLDNLITTIETDTGVTSDHVSLISHEQFLNPRTCRAADGSPYTMENRIWIKDITMANAQQRFICDRTFRGAQQRNDLALSPVASAFAQAGHIPHAYSPTNVRQLFAFVRFYSDYYSTGPGRNDAQAKARASNASRVRFNLETKVTPVAAALELAESSAPHDKTFSPEVFAKTLNSAIAADRMESRCFVQSFDFRTLVLTQAAYPRVRTVYLVEGANALRPEALPSELREDMR